MTIFDVLRKSPILSYFILAYVMSWSFWIPLVIFYLQNPLAVSEMPFLFFVIGLLGVFGPTFASITVASAEGNTERVKILFSRWKNWRAKKR